MKLDYAIENDIDGWVFYYQHDGTGGAWLLSYNALNPDEDDSYFAFTSERKLRRWVQSEYPGVRWEEISEGIYRGFVADEAAEHPGGM